MLLSFLGFTSTPPLFAPRHTLVEGVTPVRTAPPVTAPRDVASHRCSRFHLLASPLSALPNDLRLLALPRSFATARSGPAPATVPVVLALLALRVVPSPPRPPLVPIPPPCPLIASAPSPLVVAVVTAIPAILAPVVAPVAAPVVTAVPAVAAATTAPLPVGGIRPGGDRSFPAAAAASGTLFCLALLPENPHLLPLNTLLDTVLLTLFLHVRVERVTLRVRSGVNPKRLRELPLLLLLAQTASVRVQRPRPLELGPAAPAVSILEQLLVLLVK
mmetsp:Transcript_29912/g.83615  ORF Transcript_29912/g.83615 Transcript_29912/m.83615 type:complete len:274 (-) Transcript_29912:307-1128(-)